MRNPPASKLDNLKPGTVWYPVPGFARYWVSTDGLVAYQDQTNQFRLKATPRTQSGHKLVALSDNGNSRSVNLIRLMAEVFIGPPPTEKHRWVRPLDGSIENVNPSNLAWSDESPNKGKQKSAATAHEDKNRAAVLLVNQSVVEVAKATGLSTAVVRHLKPGHVYEARPKLSPLATTVVTGFPPIDPVVEEWRPIPDAAGYDVSSFGRVRSWKGLAPRIQRPSLVAGYPRVTLRTDGAVRQVAVHRLVAEAFCPRTRPEQVVVNHIDGRRSNNHFSNLEWATHAENARHAHESGLWKPSPRHGQRWKRPPVEAYASILGGEADAARWHPSVVQALRDGLYWANESAAPIAGEEWKPVGERGLPPGIEVSSLGRVRREGRLLRQSLSTHGYPVTSVYIAEGRSKTARTHVLVAEAFLGPRPSAEHVVNHRDLNKQNNLLSNLEWATYSSNSEHWSLNRLPLDQHLLQGAESLAPRSSCTSK